MSSSLVAAMAADAVGRGAAGRFPAAAAAVEVEDPLVAPPFFTMVAAAELFFLSANGGWRRSLFSLWERRRVKAIATGASEQGEGKNP